MDDTLSILINAKMASHQWSQSDLARKSGLNRAVISKILSGNTKPTPDTCRDLALALELPIEQVFRAAGLLPPQPKEDPLVNLITYLSEQLPTDEDKQDAAEYIRLRLRLAEERGKHESADKKRPSKT